MTVSIDRDSNTQKITITNSLITTPVFAWEGMSGGQITNRSVTAINANVYTSIDEAQGAYNAWQATTAYKKNDRVVNDTDAKSYVCVSAGTSAGSGGPTGTGTGIVDGTVQWDYETDTGFQLLKDKNGNTYNITVAAGENKALDHETLFGSYWIKLLELTAGSVADVTIKAAG